MATTPQFVIPTERKTHKKYVDAISGDSPCKEEAICTLREHTAKRATEKQCTATITLAFKVPLYQIRKSAVSAGRRLDGHSERRALAMAINEAIENRLPGFADRKKIDNTENPTKEELNAFKQALSSCSSIIIFTERIPCNKPQASSEPRENFCEPFFAALFEDCNYQFYYSVKLANGAIMEQDLRQQYEEAKSTLETHEAFVEKQAQELLQDLPSDAFDSSQDTQAPKQPPKTVEIASAGALIQDQAAEKKSPEVKKDDEIPDEDLLKLAEQRKPLATGATTHHEEAQKPTKKRPLSPEQKEQRAELHGEEGGAPQALQKEPPKKIAAREETQAQQSGALAERFKQVTQPMASSQQQEHNDSFFPTGIQQSFVDRQPSLQQSTKEPVKPSHEVQTEITQFFKPNPSGKKK